MRAIFISRFFYILLVDTLLKTLLDFLHCREKVFKTNKSMSKDEKSEKAIPERLDILKNLNRRYNCLFFLSHERRKIFRVGTKAEILTW